MKVDIFIHGVPNGQRIWSTGGDDQIINQFYGAGGEENTKYLAEVKKSGGQNFCYYSLLKYKNVLAENGRAGSYFGLTIRMDMVCTKVKAVFQILDMVYSAAVIGKFIRKEGERLQFAVGDFKDKEPLCKTIVEKIMAMLGQSVEVGDFVNITPSMLNGRGTLKFNSAEYTSETALAGLGQYSSIAVSPEYPSTQFAAVIKQKDADFSNYKQQVAMDIKRIQSQAAQDLQDQEVKSNALILQIREQASHDIEQTKAKYSDIDRKLIAYDQQLKQMQRNNRELQDNLVVLQRQLKERDNMITRLQRSSVGTSQTNPHSGNTRKSGMEIFVTQVLPFVNLLIVIVVLAVLFLHKPSDNTKAIDQISADITELKDRLAPQSETASQTEGVTGGTKTDVEMTLKSSTTPTIQNSKTKSDDNNKGKASQTGKSVTESQSLFNDAKEEAAKSQLSEKE